MSDKQTGVTAKVTACESEGVRIIRDDGAPDFWLYPRIVKVT